MRTPTALACVLALGLLGATDRASAQGHWPEHLSRGPAPEIRQNQEWVRDQRWRREADFQRQQDRAAAERDLGRLERDARARVRMQGGAGPTAPRR